VSTLVTYCCKDKRSDSDPISAIERYRSWRIKYVWRKAQAEDRPMLILSGLMSALPA
jgi:hypothetical protein